VARLIKFTVRLNGTAVNPYARFGLKQNPFPEVAEAEYAPHVLHLQALGGEPIPDEAHIRRHLKGWPKEFVDELCRRFTPGEMVAFEVSFPADAAPLGGPVQY
jgi:hypothetical protein